jgi:hypothetical protein
MADEPTTGSTGPTTTGDNAPSAAKTSAAANKPGRFTPPKAPPAGSGTAATAAGVTRPQTSGRYTPPASREAVVVRGTGRWVVPLLFALLIIGALMIIVNYIGWLPGAPSNWWLLGGMGCLVGALIVATQLK